MILLDTNYLIMLLVPGSPEAERIHAWFTSGVEILTSSVVWYEFLSGPVDAEGIIVAGAILRNRIIPFTADQAAEGSRLWNATGRKRGLRVDAMIAATSIITNAELATANVADFSVFAAFGLRIKPAV